MKVMMIGSDPRQGLLYYPTRLAVALSDRDCEVHVLSWGDREQSPGLREMLTEARVQLHAAQSLSYAAMRALVRPAHDVGQIIAAIRPDIVHTFGPISLFQARKRRGSDPGFRVCAVSQMRSSAESSVLPRMGAWILNAYAEAVVAQCELEHKRLERVGVDRRRLATIYAPLDVKGFLANGHDGGRDLRRERGLPSDVRLLGYFANLWPAKQHLLLLWTFARMAIDFPSWHLVLAGEGSEEGRCREFVREAGLEPRVHFLGRLPTAQMPWLIREMDAVVHASRAETFGYSIIEPLLFNKPVLAVEAGIARELREAGRALVVDRVDCDAFDLALRRILTGDEEVVAAASEGREYVTKTFDLPVIAGQLLALYERVVRNNER